jgi:DNA polymerase III epsilon subunit-like protein
MKLTAVFDTETTGLLLPDAAALEDQPQIIEFGVAILDEKYKVKKRVAWLINPGRSLPAEITKITGLKDDDLKGKPAFADVLPEIEQLFLGVTRVMAHNLPFDLGMLTNELKRINRQYAFPYPPEQVCTAQLSEQYKGKRMRLLQLYEHVLGRPLAQTHRALDDVDALVEIIQHEKY